jgi:hypothetical protein
MPRADLVEVTMFPLDYVLAMTLLTAPVDEPIPPNLEAPLVTVRPTMQAVALHWEILDRRELRYVFTRSEDFTDDLKLLRKRHADLADAPPLHDCMRFPDRTLINELLAFNRAYRQHLDSQQALEVTYWWEYHEMLQEADRLYQVWDTVRDARCDYYYVTVRRQALKKLRDNVGDQAYFSGRLPPHVPIWRFSHID